eukprot:jgi/Bigna1/78341/fgenesh1_pg.54_\
MCHGKKLTGLDIYGIIFVLNLSLSHCAKSAGLLLALARDRISERCELVWGLLMPLRRRGSVLCATNRSASSGTNEERQITRPCLYITLVLLSLSLIAILVPAAASRWSRHSLLGPCISLIHRSSALRSGTEMDARLHDAKQMRNRGDALAASRFLAPCGSSGGHGCHRRYTFTRAGISCGGGGSRSILGGRRGRVLSGGAERGGIPPGAKRIVTNDFDGNDEEDEEDVALRKSQLETRLRQLIKRNTKLIADLEEKTIGEGASQEAMDMVKHLKKMNENSRDLFHVDSDKILGEDDYKAIEARAWHIIEAIVRKFINKTMPADYGKPEATSIPESVKVDAEEADKMMAVARESLQSEFGHGMFRDGQEAVLRDLFR